MDDLLNFNASSARKSIDNCVVQKDREGLKKALTNENLFVKIYTINRILELDDPDMIPELVNTVSDLPRPMTGGEDLTSIEETTARVVAFVNKWKNKDYKLDDPSNEKVASSLMKKIKSDLNG